MEELPQLARLNISGNGLTEVNTGHVKHLLQLNCNDNSLRTLSVVDGPLRILTARNNSMYTFIVWQLVVENTSTGNLEIFVVKIYS